MLQAIREHHPSRLQQEKYRLFRFLQNFNGFGIGFMGIIFHRAKIDPYFIRGLKERSKTDSHTVFTDHISDSLRHFAQKPQPVM